MTPNHEELVIRAIEKWTSRMGKILNMNITFCTDQATLDRLLDIEKAIREISYIMIADDLNEDDNPDVS